MTTTARFAEIAALAGDPARAAMLQALMDGRALTATELAALAGVTPQTASGHLGKLVESGFLTVIRQGRHRYHRLASPEIARMIEAIMQVAAANAAPVRRLSTGPRDNALRRARTCYDHLAGQLGVRIADALVARGHAEIEEEAGRITETGLDLFARLGIGLEEGATPRQSTRLFCRPCLDWSERRPHLAGRIGAALCAHCLDRGWVRRIAGSRALDITPKGAAALREAFGVTMG